MRLFHKWGVAMIVINSKYRLGVILGSLIIGLLIFFKLMDDYVVGNYTFAWNVDHSLERKVFFLSRGYSDLKVGQKVFFAKEGHKVIKIIGGVAGDVVEQKNREFYINGKYMGYAKPLSKKGKALEIGFNGTIPEGKYFLYTPHKDSFDSRYKAMGLIDESDIIGTAIALY